MNKTVKLKKIVKRFCDLIPILLFQQIVNKILEQYET
jgi:hypothetical protein